MKKLYTRPLFYVLIFSIGLILLDLFIVFASPLRITDATLTIGLVTVVPTMAIAVIAYLELTKLSNINIDNSVLQLDSQWRAESIIRARKIVDEIFQKYYHVQKMNYIIAVEKTSEEILKLSHPENLKELKIYESKIIDLLCLIEFFDTLGFLYNNGHQEIKDQVRELFEDSAIFYYSVFQRYIENASRHSKTRFPRACPWCLLLQLQ